MADLNHMLTSEPIIVIQGVWCPDWPSLVDTSTLEPEVGSAAHKFPGGQWGKVWFPKRKGWVVSTEEGQTEIYMSTTVSQNSKTDQFIKSRLAKGS